MQKIISTLDNIVNYVDENKSKYDLICSFLLALIPLLQHYIGIIDNASTTLLIIMLPYLMLRMLSKTKTFKFSQLSVLSVLIVFFIYKLIDHGTFLTEIAQVLIIIILFVAVSLRCINTKAVIKTASLIATAAGIVLIIQYFCFYVCNFHLQVVPTELLLPESEDWVALAQTGIIGVNGVASDFYRPSAFFLEPSHLFLYSFPLLFINLFDKNNDKKNMILAILITCGIVLSTSGMGIFVVIGAWFVYFALRDKDSNTFRIENVFSKRNLTHVTIYMIFVAVLLYFVPFLRESIMRIFVNDSGSTAIDGRTEIANQNIEKMSFIQKIFGSSDTTAHLKGNMPGYNATIYKYGIVGILLSYEFYIKSLFKLDISNFLISSIIFIVSFFSAHTHGTFFMIFYVMLLMNGHLEGYKSFVFETLITIKNFIVKLLSPKA